MKYLFCSVLAVLLSLYGFSQTNNITVSGQIVAAENGAPLIGVSIYLSKINSSAISDARGNFSLEKISLPDTLVLSYIGYVTQYLRIDKNTILPLRIGLRKGTGLMMDAVTVFNTGYQSISKERATGSFTQVDNKIINQQVGSNILNRLESVASSVAFNKKNNYAPAISVRGLSTINGPSSPLIVLDNFPFEGDINSIDPNMIESITILKDATAASIWGTRAGNGVIVINTKKGKYNQPFTIDFNSNVQVYAKPDLSYIRPIATSDYINVEQYLYGQGFYDNLLTDPSHPVISPVVELLDEQSRGIISPAEAEAQIAALRKINVRDEFNRYVYQNTINQQYAINFSGGNSQSTWAASGSYDRNLSELSEKYQRITARLENSFRPVKNLQITGRLYFAGTNSASGKDGYTSQNYLYPYSQLANVNGAAVPAARDYRLTYIDTAGGGRLLDWKYYPLEDYKHSYSKTQRFLCHFQALT